MLILTALVTVSCSSGSVNDLTSPTHIVVQPSAVQPTAVATTVPTSVKNTSLKGVSLSPKSFTDTDFPQFLSLVGQAGNALRWAGPWTDLGVPNGAPLVVTTLSKNYNYTPVIETGVYSVSRDELIKPLTQENMDQFVLYVREFSRNFKMPYIALGVEVNIHYEKHPDDFQKYVLLFDRAYDAIKSVSPDTKVYLVFQLERMKGLQGGLFGGTNDTANAQWDLLKQFPKSDLIGFTTYPGLIYKDPSEIPSDYYSEIVSRTDKPIAFTEVGWASGTPVFKGASLTEWASSEAEQASFVKQFRQLTSGMNPEMSIWFWMFEQSPPPGPAFVGMALRRDDGTPRPAWDEWVK